MSKDLLIYTTIANRADNIKFSVLIDPEKKTAVMPSITIESDGRENWSSDNQLYILHKLLPALKAHQSRTMTDEQRKIIWSLSIYNCDITELIDILEYAIENNLLNETM